MKKIGDALASLAWKNERVAQFQVAIDEYDKVPRSSMISWNPSKNWDRTRSRASNHDSDNMERRRHDAFPTLFCQVRRLTMANAYLVEPDVGFIKKSASWAEPTSKSVTSAPPALWPVPSLRTPNRSRAKR
jgi:hypothetical protein